MRRKRKHPQHQGMSPFTAGLIAIVLIAVGRLVRVHEVQPVREPLQAHGRVRDGQQPQAATRPCGSPAWTSARSRRSRPLPGGRRDASTMEIKDKGLPIHEDAELKVRPRIFLEGNFFVDLTPGSPSAPVLEDGGDPIPMNQTSAPVQFGDLLAALQSDTRSDLQVFLKEYSKGLVGQGRAGLQPVAALRRGRLQELGDREPGDARAGAHQRRAAPAQGPAEDLRRARRGRGGAEGPRHQLQRDRRRLRTRGRGAGGARSRRCATCCGSARPRWRRSTPRCRRCARSRSTPCRACAPRARRWRPRCRSSARPVLLVGPRELRGARPGAAPPAARTWSGLNVSLVPFLEQARAAVLLHQRRALAVRQVADPQPRRAGQHRPAVLPPGQRAASWACRARAASATATTPSSTPAPRRSARRCGPRPRPTAASSRRRGAPTCPVRPRSRPT